MCRGWHTVERGRVPRLAASLAAQRISDHASANRRLERTANPKRVHRSLTVEALPHRHPSAGVAREVIVIYRSRRLSTLSFALSKRPFSLRFSETLGFAVSSSETCTGVAGRFFLKNSAVHSCTHGPPPSFHFLVRISETCDSISQIGSSNRSVRKLL